MPIVMSPVTVTVPVDTVTLDVLLNPASVMFNEPQVSEPAFTARVFSTAPSPPVPTPTVTLLVTVKLFVAVMVSVVLFPPLLRSREAHTAAVFTLMVALIPFGITTSSVASGTRFKSQLFKLFQLSSADPSHVMVCA